MTDHFSKKELQCRCGCGQLDMEPGFLERLESLRVGFDKPMVVNSGYRCRSHNAAASNTGRFGPHTTGMAVDIAVCGEDAYDLVSLAMTMGFSGIGVSQRGPWGKRFIHIDDLPVINRSRPRIWSY